MWGYRSQRSQRPSPQQVFYDADKRAAQDIEATYEVAIAQWSVEQGCEARDFTPDQLDRFEAFRIAGADVRIARCLIFGQMLYDTERLSEYPSPEKVTP